MEHAAEASDAAKPDRLSSLPDSLLHRILFLSSMGAMRLVQTSTLSRRWRHVWRETPCLDVGPRDLHFQQGGDDLPEKWVRFNSFSESLFLHHEALGLDELRMQVVEAPKDQNGRWSKPDGNSWVRRCLARYAPAALDIGNLSPSGAHVQLRGVSRGTVLGRLTTMRLAGVTLCTGFENLLGAAGCPLLERLELKDCLVGFKEVVLSPTLKTLLVDSCNMRMDNESSLRVRDTPRVVAHGLASLHLVLFSARAPLWDFDDMPSLVEATVRLDRGVIDNEFMLLRSLRNVTKLEISTFPSLDLVMKKRRFDKADLPKFSNLTTLLLDQCRFTTDAPTLLERFILLAPNLEKLTLHNCKLPTCSERMVERSMSTEMSYYHSNLRFVEIKHCKNDDGVCGVVDYLLRVSKNLQRTGIVLSKGQEEPWYHATLEAQGWYQNEFGHFVPRAKVF